MSAGLVPELAHSVWFTGIMWQPPIGINDDRNGKPLRVPFTATRPRVPNVFGTSIGGTIADTITRFEEVQVNLKNRLKLLPGQTLAGSTQQLAFA
jgi:hypothetical protein